jgi:ADP-ribose pyrophosphatase
VEDPRWLAWGKKLQAIAQIGLAYTRDPYDRERFEQVRAVAFEMLAAGSDVPLETVRSVFAEDHGYATPKVDVRGVVFDAAGRLLLVREREDGLWTLPGGWADVTDSPGEAVIKEVREEAGFAVRPVKLLAVLDYNRQGHHPPRAVGIYKLFLRCEITGGAAAFDDLETSAVGFFAEDALPELSEARTTPAEVRRLFDHYRNPDLAADFD